MAAELKTNNMRTPFKLRSSGLFKLMGSSSPMKGKPTKKELVEAANNKDHPMYIDASSTDEQKDANLNWKLGGRLVPSTGTYHGAGGKIMDEDGTVNKEKTIRNVAHLR